MNQPRTNQLIAPKENFKQLYTERLLAALGKITMEKLEKKSILIYNLRATGVELAKNVALLAPKNVTLIDDSIVTERDKTFNLYARDADIGKHRSEVLSERL